VAVSGSNIALGLLCIGFFFKFIIGFGRTKLYTIGLLLFLFCGLVGFGVPVVRASIMGFIGYIGLVYGGKVHTGSLILLSILYFGISEPIGYIADTSLLLSFLAVGGIVYIG
jgi:predicted membrane metal-binding protein